MLGLLKHVSLPSPSKLLPGLTSPLGTSTRLLAEGRPFADPVIGVWGKSWSLSLGA